MSIARCWCRQYRMLPHITSRPLSMACISSDEPPRTSRTGSPTLMKTCPNKKFRHKIVQNSNLWANAQWMLWGRRSLLTFGFPFSIWLFIAYLWPVLVRIVAFSGIQSPELIVCGTILSSRIFIALVRRHTSGFHTQNKNENGIETAAPTPSKHSLSRSFSLVHFTAQWHSAYAVVSGRMLFVFFTWLKYFSCLRRAEANWRAYTDTHTATKAVGGGHGWVHYPSPRAYDFLWAQKRETDSVEKFSEAKSWPQKSKIARFELKS